MVLNNEPPLTARELQQRHTIERMRGELDRAAKLMAEITVKAASYKIQADGLARLLVRLMRVSRGLVESPGDGSLEAMRAELESVAREVRELLSPGHKRPPESPIVTP